MIEIKKGKTILKVSKGSYKEIFKSQGYEIVNEEIKKGNKKQEEKQIENVETEKEVKEEIVNSEKLMEKIDMGVNDNIFPSKEKKKGK